MLGLLQKRGGRTVNAVISVVRLQVSLGMGWGRGGIQAPWGPHSGRGRLGGLLPACAKGPEQLGRV